MKTLEDEAFEDIERRQGGGFPAKRAMAADKQREWVGLTDDEILKMAYPIRWQEIDDFEADKAVNFAQMVEAKLKEKNS